MLSNLATSSVVKSASLYPEKIIGSQVSAPSLMHAAINIVTLSEKERSLRSTSLKHLMARPRWSKKIA